MHSRVSGYEQDSLWLVCDDDDDDDDDDDVGNHDVKTPTCAHKHTHTQHRMENGDTVTQAHPVDPARCFHAALKQKISCELVHGVILMQQTCSTLSLSLSLSHKHTHGSWSPVTSQLTLQSKLHAAQLCFACTESALP